MHSDPLSLGVATPERVALSMPIAGVGSRTAAYLIDVSLLLLFWLAVYFTLTLLTDVQLLVTSMSSLAQVIAVFGLFATQWVYWTACEVLWNGQTPGKRLAGIRVVREDGAPVTFFDSAVRNLLRGVDFLPAAYAVGVVAMLVTPQHRRLGDLAAGTLLIRREEIDLDRYSAPEHMQAQNPGPASSEVLSGRDAELVLSFLDRAEGLEPAARTRIASGLVQRLGAEVSAEEAEDYLRARVQR